MNERDLRLILTKDCNYQCTFCHQEGVNHEIFKTLNNEDYLFLYDNIRQKEGIKDITLTGGEPLMYKQIESLSKLFYDRGAKITMVTNGSLLHKHPEIGKRLNRINISLHTLNQDKYSDLAQIKVNINRIIGNIALMRKLYPNLLIRLNATVVKGRNDNIQDISAMVDLSDKYGLSIKFVELYPTTDPTFIPLENIEPILETLGFEKYQQKGRQTIFGKGKRIIILTKIFCGAGNEYDLKSNIPAKERDIFVSPDGRASPYPSDIKNINLYDSIKTRNKQEIETLVNQAISEANKSSIGKVILTQ